MPRDLLGSAEDAAELMAEVDAQLRNQAAEETMNVFGSVKDLREFAKTVDLSAGVPLTVVMCVASVDRLANNRGTRITLVDGFMQPHWKAYRQKLDTMEPSCRDARVVKITVWDPKVRSAGRPRFQVGTIYELKKIHAIQFYHDVLQGSLQAVGTTNPGLIEEYADFQAAKRARLEMNGARANNDDNEEQKEETEELMF
ncbi:hypothetical protein DVH05_010488 [Phytophthora capsici]|nr:hypothetical protein DVH05_004464 [Phytophthora capsici]KAG1695630.1 hypothetical protein DVH05_019369 [Phytophthora capsici]KAG1701998.1 hypothetical protein DVH05_010488 [Phytophthora capsici]